MKLLELNQDDLATANYDPENDKVNARKLSDTRKPVMTLKDVNKLKKIRAMRKLEDAKRQDLLGIMYAAPGGDAGGGGGFGGF